MTKKEIQKAVLKSLNNAVENDYNFRGSSAKEIAYDLIDYDAAFEDFDFNVLIPAVKEWQKHHKWGPDSLAD